MTENKKILDSVSEYYSEKIIKHGATSQGVDWNGKESHYIRFDQLTKLVEGASNFSILDYGCGFGSLIDYLKHKKIACNYTGYDISKEMLEKASSIYTIQDGQFISRLTNKKFDFTIANGIFNVKLDVSEMEWKKYIVDTISQINEISIKGFAFNILTSYSDEEYKKDYLHYADPLYYFDYCKNNFSRNVSLLHCYNLYEFTIIVKK